jgi:magnesium and cobalt exporter, CNNM family
MTDILIWGGALFLAVAASFLFSGFETGVYVLNRVRLRFRQESGNRTARRLQGILERPVVLIAVILVGNNVANFAASFSSQELLIHALGPIESALLNTVVLSPILFIFGEITPKDCFRRRADTWVEALTPVIAPLVSAATSLRRVLSLLPGVPEPGNKGSGGMAFTTRRRIELSFQESAEEGGLSDHQGRLVSNILKLRRIALREVMTPLLPANLLPESVTVGETVRTARDSRAARLLVFRDDPKKLTGQIIVRELIGCGPDDPVLPLVRSVLTLDGGMTAMRALLQLRRDHRTQAVVTQDDRPVGVVTMKDLAEAVVGELPGW